MHVRWTCTDTGFLLMHVPARVLCLWFNTNRMSKLGYGWGNGKGPVRIEKLGCAKRKPISTLAVLYRSFCMLTGGHRRYRRKIYERRQLEGGWQQHQNHRTVSHHFHRWRQIQRTEATHHRVPTRPTRPVTRHHHPNQNNNTALLKNDYAHILKDGKLLLTSLHNS